MSEHPSDPPIAPPDEAVAPPRAATDHHSIQLGGGVSLAAVLGGTLLSTQRRDS